MTQRTELPARAGRGLVYVVVDTPRGSSNKYKFDADLHTFALSRRLPSGMHFPHDFGSIPNTLGDDGDALDVVVLTDTPSFVGCLMTVRLIGAIGAYQIENRRRIKNDRLVGVAVTPVNKPRIRELTQVPTTEVEALEQFFVNYNRAHGRQFSLTGRLGARSAERLLDAAIRQRARKTAT
jgi:inorganic pyrophosphatase